MYCWKCGKQNGEGSGRCSACGADLMHPDAEQRARSRAARPRRKGRKGLVIALLAVFLVISLFLSILLHPYFWSFLYDSLNPGWADAELPEPTPTLPPYTERILSPEAAGRETVLFGRYEQDNISVNGPEEIEWIVLGRNGSKLLLLSRYALDCQRYHERKRNVTWESCTLRGWLNETFLQEAFSEEEAERILTVTVEADRNESSADPGNPTEDRIFLLSSAEAERLFSSNAERVCVPTAYASAQGAYEWGSSGCCEWWLRTPGSSRKETSLVSYSGYIFLSGAGSTVESDDIGVRPALWVELG